MDNNMVITRLKLASAKSEQLAEDLRRGKLWEGELQRGISEVIEQMKQALKETKK